MYESLSSGQHFAAARSLRRLHYATTKSESAESAASTASRAQHSESRDAFNVKPSAHRGVVTLTGNVPTPEIKTTLLAAVRRVHGVERIVDRITIAR